MDFYTNLYKEIFQLSPLPMWVYDISTLCFLDVNEAAIYHYGYTRTEFLNMSIKDLSPAVSGAESEKAVKEVNEYKDRFTTKITKHLKKNGEIISVEIKSNLFGSNGKLAEFVIATDITAQLNSELAAKTSKEELLLSEKRFKSLVQAGSDLIAVIDMDGKYQFLSESFINLLNIYPEKMAGKMAFDYVHPDDRERVTDNLKELDKLPHVHIEPFRFLNGNDEWRWLTTIATNLIDDPSVSGIVTNSTDVTELINTNNELRLSNERYKLMLKAADEAICDWDIENDCVDWGVGFQEIFGYDLTIYNNTLWSDNIYPEDKERVLKELDNAIQNPATETLYSEYRFLKKNREVAIIQYRGIFLRNESGKATRAVGSFRDITNYRHNIFQVHRQNQKLQEIAWMQSHKIRDSLSKIIGLVELLNAEEFITEPQKMILAYLNTSTADLDKGIRDIVQKAQSLDTAEGFNL